MLHADLPGCAAPRWLEQPLEPAGKLEAFPAPGAEPPAIDPELRSLLTQVSQLRGLAAPPRLRLVALPADELARAALAQSARDWPEPARRAQAHLLWRLGLLPRDCELLASLRPALEAALDAFYARVGGVPTLHVRSTLRGSQRSAALAHELVHALQDHEHALLETLADGAHSSDRRSALHALAEADALAVVEQLGLPTTQSQAVSPPLPAVLLRSLAAPYHDGRAAVAQALRTGGFRAVDGLLRQPPASTHALLQPEAAVRTPLPGLSPPAAAWQLGFADVLGEQALRVVLEEQGEAAAARAAAWRADHFSLFEGREGALLAWQLELTDAEAAAGMEPLFHLARSRPDFETESGTGLPVAEWTCGAHRDGGVVATARGGARLVFASFTPGSQIAPANAQCATVQAWISRAGFAPRPGSGEPHRSRRTPPGSRSETVQAAPRALAKGS